MIAVPGSAEGLWTAVGHAGQLVGADTGDRQTSYADLFARIGIEVGVWTSTPGGWSIDNRPDTEVGSVLSSRARITEADDVRHGGRARRRALVAQGWSGRWGILEPLEELHVTIETEENA